MKASLPAGTRSIVIGHRHGRQAGPPTCAGRRLGQRPGTGSRGSTARTVSSLYGVKALYAARGPVHERRLGHAGLEPQPHAAAELDRGAPADPVADVRLHRGHRRQPLAGHDHWPKVAAAGKRFAFMKATEGIDFVDPRTRRTAPRRRRTASRSAPTTSRSPARTSATRSPRPTGSSRHARSGRAASCSRCSTSRSPAA